MGEIGVLEEVIDDSLLTLPSRASFRFSCSSKTGDITVTCDCQAASIDAASEACCCGHGAILFDLFKSQSHGCLHEEEEPQVGGEEEDNDGIREFEFEFEFCFPSTRTPLQQLLPDNLSNRGSPASSHHHSGTETLPDRAVSCYNWKPCLHSDAQSSSRIKIKGPANHALNYEISSSKQKRQARHGHHEKWATFSVFTFRAPEAFIKSLLGLVTKTKLQNLHMNEVNDHHQCMMISADSCKLRVDDHHDQHARAEVDCGGAASNPRGAKHKSLMALQCLNRYLIKPVNHLLSNKPHLQFHHVKKTLSGATVSGMPKFRKSGQIHNREEELGDEHGHNPNSTSSSSARRTPSFSRRLRGNYPQLWRANSFPLKRAKGAPKCSNDAHQSKSHHPSSIISSSDAHNGIQSAIAYCKQSATI